MIVQEPVQAAIWHCLNHYDYEDAIFLSERLYAEVKTDDCLFLLATAYYRSGKIDHAYYVLKDKCGKSPSCRYLLGNCAYNLKKFDEAEAALLQEDSSNNKFEDIITTFGDQAAFALFLLAKISVKTERRQMAIDAFKKALKLNPFLWSCFVELCKLGEKPNPVNTFQVAGLDNFAACNGSTHNNIENVVTAVNQDLSPYINTPQQILVNSTYYSNINSKYCTPEESPLANPLCMSGLGLLPTPRVKNLRHKLIDSGQTTTSLPSFGLLPLDSPDSYINSTPLLAQATLTEANDQHKSLAKKVRAHMGHLISRKESTLQNAKPVFSHSTNVNNTISMTPSVPTAINNNMQSNQSVRRSSRLFSNNSYSVKENNKSPNRNKFATPKSPSRKTKQRLAKCNLNKNSTFVENARNRMEKEKSETITSTETAANNAIIASTTSVPTLTQQAAAQMQKQSAEGLMVLLRSMGWACLHLAQYKCNEVIDDLSGLPSHHYETAWVHTMLALAYFEMADYEHSAKFFNKVRKREPHRLKYMDVYSTALWHLQKEVTLSALAQELTTFDRNSPVTWCVNGNCFSLHKEHDTAIKFFQRAVQVDGEFTYAYTLLGHEYIMTEELDKAMSCFRSAIRIDPRHYNAWFGIGTIYSKQERFQLAEIIYMRALSINPNSSVLRCHIGVVQHALKKTDQALATLNAAISMDNKNPLCKFHRGSIYFAVGRHAEALKELEELKEIVPKESLVYYLIGKVHKKLGNTHLALMHFSWATDLDPKGASSQIKEAFDPSVGRNSTTEIESPASPSEDCQSESNNSVQQDAFSGLPEDSDDSL